jgi:hypothetical protein
MLQFSITIGISLSTLAPNIAKIPFLLIEDLLQNQTTSNAEATWAIVESMTDSLTKPELFNKGMLLWFIIFK